eukprot:365376-Chlamydomonas_euryale.AAC.11
MPHCGRFGMRHGAVRDAWHATPCGTPCEPCGMRRHATPCWMRRHAAPCDTMQDAAPRGAMRQHGMRRRAVCTTCLTPYGTGGHAVPCGMRLNLADYMYLTVRERRHQQRLAVNDDSASAVAHAARPKALEPLVATRGRSHMQHGRRGVIPHQRRRRLGRAAVAAASTPAAADAGTSGGVLPLRFEHCQQLGVAAPRQPRHRPAARQQVKSCVQQAVALVQQHARRCTACRAAARTAGGRGRRPGARRHRGHRSNGWRLHSVQMAAVGLPRERRLQAVCRFGDCVQLECGAVPHFDFAAAGRWHACRKVLAIAAPRDGHVQPTIAIVAAAAAAVIPAAVAVRAATSKQRHLGKHVPFERHQQQPPRARHDRDHVAIGAPCHRSNAAVDAADLLQLHGVHAAAAAAATAVAGRQPEEHQAAA